MLGEGQLKLSTIEDQLGAHSGAGKNVKIDRRGNGNFDKRRRKDEMAGGGCLHSSPGPEKKDPASLK